jgi:tetratricopeptide (TPR) repeat protein
LASLAKDENKEIRAQQVYAQFLNKWPDDPRVPEILLRQGQLFRQMGLNTMALAKFYGVMTSSLVLKNDKLDYYQTLVVIAQMEIAETHYLMGKHAEAADFYERLLKQNNPLLDRSLIQFRLLRSLEVLGRHDEVVGQGEEFIARFGEASEQPEVRFHVARSLKQLGRNEESLEQVLMLLQEQKARMKEHPELWSYWQQRAGNEIANQFYREGDFGKALDIYLSLEQLDCDPSWQLPVAYQVAMTYERLLQPAKAAQIYGSILDRESEASRTASPGLKAVFEMARWRRNFIHWQERAEAINQSLSNPLLAVPISNSFSSTLKISGSEIAMP